jgi:hypothetical protein
MLSAPQSSLRVVSRGKSKDRQNVDARDKARARRAAVETVGQDRLIEKLFT